MTRTKDDLLPVLSFLSRRLFPFNYALPGESMNSLLDLEELAKAHPRIEDLRDALQRPPFAASRLVATLPNEFTAPSYKVIHFVVDLPVRIPAEKLRTVPQASRALGPVTFVLAEFQLVDEATERANEQGEASHDSYKERQRQAVINRLRLGISSRAASRAKSTPTKGR